MPIHRNFRINKEDLVRRLTDPNDIKEAWLRVSKELANLSKHNANRSADSKDPLTREEAEAFADFATNFRTKDNVADAYELRNALIQRYALINMIINFWGGMHNKSRLEELQEKYDGCVTQNVTPVFAELESQYCKKALPQFEQEIKACQQDDACRNEKKYLKDYINNLAGDFRKAKLELQTSSARPRGITHH
jgi:hypothetical protein